MSYGKSIELFLVNGTADSLITAELSNWNGKALKIPRIEVATCDRDDLKQAGVYFLFCKEDDGSDSVYIGEAENVKDRLKQHLKDYDDEKEKYYWNTAVVFIGTDLNKALIRYLENKFVLLAKSSNRYKILTKNTYKNTVMKESQIAAMDEFVDNVKIIINALGYKVLEPYVTNSSTVKIDDEVLYIKTPNVDAKGKVTSEGFVVFKDSKISNIEAKSLSKGSKTRRFNLERTGAIKNNIIQQDILFSSSSAASDFVLGYSSSGPQTWINKDGLKLKELESI